MSFDMGPKKCNTCKETKPVECFGKDRARKDGLHSQCKSCRKAYYEANREKELERLKAYYEANKEKIRERQKAYWKAYYETNREKLREYNKDYHEANREKVQERRKNHYETNKERYVTLSSKYRASKRNAVPKHLRKCPIEHERITAIYKLRKVISDATGIEHHVDHMWPLSKGGPHWSGNLQIITAEENLSKNATLDKRLKKVIQSALKEDRERYKHEPHDSIRY
jgi:hypothetical protein